MKYKLEVSWTLAGTVEVEADSFGEAVEKAEQLPLPNGEYVEDSWRVDSFSVNCGEQQEPHRSDVVLSTGEILYIFAESQWRTEDSREFLEGRLNNIRDLLRPILHDAGIVHDKDIAENDSAA